MRVSSAPLTWFLTGFGIGVFVGVVAAPCSGANARRLGREYAGRGRELYERGRQMADEAAHLFEEGQRLMQEADQHAEVNA